MSREALRQAMKYTTPGAIVPVDIHTTRLLTEALKQALEQPEPEPMECHTCKGLGRIYMGCGSWIHCDTCNTTGKATIPPKREPPCKTGSQCITKCMECTEQEPVIDKSAAIRIATSLGWTPKREWQGLTDEDLYVCDEDGVKLARYWEAKLKEKNSG